MPVTIDEIGYPHIIQRIMSYIDRSTLLAFRGTNKRYMEAIDATLFEHVAVVQSQCPRINYMRSPHAPYLMLPRVPTLETIDLSKYTTEVDFYPTAAGIDRVEIPDGRVVKAFTHFVDPATTHVPLFRERGLQTRGPAVVRGPGQVWRAMPYADAVVLSMPINRRLPHLPYHEERIKERGLSHCKEFVVHLTWEDTNFNDVDSLGIGLKDLHVWIDPKHVRPSDKFTLVIDPPPKAYMVNEAHLQLRDDILDALCVLFQTLAGHFIVYDCHPRICVVGLDNLDKNLLLNDGGGGWHTPAYHILDAIMQQAYVEHMEALARAEEDDEDDNSSDGSWEDEDEGPSDDEVNDKEDNTDIFSVILSTSAVIPMQCEPYEIWCEHVDPAYRKGRVGIKQAMATLMASGLFTPSRYLRTRAKQAEGREKQKQENMREVEKKREAKKAKKALALEVQAAAVARVKA